MFLGGKSTYRTRVLYSCISVYSVYNCRMGSYYLFLSILTILSHGIYIEFSAVFRNIRRLCACYTIVQGVCIGHD